MWNKIKKNIKDYVEEIKDFQRVPLFKIVGDVAKEHIVKEKFEKDENKEKIFIIADKIKKGEVISPTERNVL